MGIEDGVEGLVIERLLDTRFRGQAHEVSMPVPDLAALSEVPDRFRDRYRELYGVAPTGRVEYAALRVRLRLPVDRPPMIDDRGAMPAVGGERRRPAYFDAGEPVEARAVRRGEMARGSEIRGPVIVEGPVDTTVVPPGWAVAVDEVGSLLVRRIV